MPKSSPKKNKKSTAIKKNSPGKNVLLALTLVPLVIGIILIGAWALDIELLSTPQAQITVGIFFFLLTFTASNAIQTRWLLAGGWGLLAVADLVTLVWLNVAAQVSAISLGVVGVVLLGIEFYKQYQQNRVKNAMK